MPHSSYKFVNARQVDAVLSPERLVLILLCASLSQRRDELCNVSNVDAAPSALALAYCDGLAPLQRHLAQRGDLDASLVDWSLANSVDDGRHYERRLDRGVLCRHVKEVVVHHARRVSPDQRANRCNIVDIVVNLGRSRARLEGWG